MIIGILSDTHDHLPMVEAAVHKLNESGVELVLHAGDYISPFVIPRLHALNAPLIGVFGNNDGDYAMLTQRFLEYDNLEIRGNFAEVEVAGLSIGLLHGHESKLLNALIKREAFDVLVFGHTHQAQVFRHGKTLVVNPGEACGYLSGSPTIALLDTTAGNAEIVLL